VDGYGNQVRNNTVYASAGDGINVCGGTDPDPNVIYLNTVGARDGKGNLGNGIRVCAGDTGNGTDSPIEIERNTVRANTLNGIWVEGVDHQLKNNVSGGTSSGDDNGDCEFLVAAGNINATGNKANGVTVPGTNGSSFPTGCIGTP
jgi:hypothetical protein